MNNLNIQMKIKIIMEFLAVIFVSAVFLVMVGSVLFYAIATLIGLFRLIGI